MFMSAWARTASVRGGLAPIWSRLRVKLRKVSESRGAAKVIARAVGSDDPQPVAEVLSRVRRQPRLDEPQRAEVALVQAIDDLDRHLATVVEAVAQRTHRAAVLEELDERRLETPDERPPGVRVAGQDSRQEPCERGHVEAADRHGQRR